MGRALREDDNLRFVWLRWMNRLLWTRTPGSGSEPDPSAGGLEAAALPPAAGLRRRRAWGCDWAPWIPLGRLEDSMSTRMPQPKPVPQKPKPPIG